VWCVTTIAWRATSYQLPIVPFDRASAGVDESARLLVVILSPVCSLVSSLPLGADIGEHAVLRVGRSRVARGTTSRHPRSP
jgi:hypothetical protein